MTDDAILVVDRLEKRFGGNRAVDGASFTVARGSITGLIGPNGAGKTTCFNCIAGALRPDGGRVTFDGHDITGEPPYRVFKRGLVRTFQIPQELGGMTVIENLMLVTAGQSGERLWEPLLRPWRVRAEERANAERAYEVLRQVALDHLALEPASNLSGGQRKLLELARALMATPKMILLDEPSAGVNPTLAQRLVDDIRAIQRDQGVTFLVIGHDMDVVARLCDTIVVMAGGRVLTEGTPDEVLSNVAVQEAYLGSQYR
ncbi:MAG: ABC transporter ATP-binding protein [Dehalococcoidia bacterium]|nr:ABC transporter ATP-binding protein [Dehalococcoidia bacterium]